MRQITIELILGGAICIFGMNIACRVKEEKIQHKKAKRIEAKIKQIILMNDKKDNG